MTKQVKICLLLVAVIILGAMAALFVLTRPQSKSGTDNNYIEIIQDNEVLCIIDLNSESDRTFRIEYNGGWNEITVENGEIRISDTDCPDRTCVKSGVLKYKNLPIICLPHRLVIKFADGE